MNGPLNNQLAEIDKNATERVNKIVKEMFERENINEELKQKNQLMVVSLMNNYKIYTEETVYNEIIFA